MYKIYVRGNYFFIENTDTNEEMEGLASNVMVHRKLNSSTSWMFHNLNGITDGIEIDESNIKDENGISYADFNLWRSENTGSPVTVSGGASVGLTDAQLRATPVPVTVSNQIDLATVQASLSSILTQVTAINANTDTVETKLSDILTEIDANGTINHNDLLNVITELQGIDANTDGLEASLLSIITNTTGSATSAKQDQIIASIGSTSDSAASSDIGTFSIISFIKRGLQNWSTFFSRFPASLGTRGGLRVEKPDQVNFAYSQAGVIAINSDLLIIDCTGLSSVSIQCTSMGTTGVVTPAWSNDNATYPAATSTLTTASGSSPATITAAGIWTTQIYGRYLRLRLTTATTGGTTTFVVQGMFNTNNLPTAGQVMTLASTTITSISAGTNLLGDVGLQVRANATGAPTPTTLNSPATPALQTIKATAGRVMSLNVSNTAATPRYIKIFNTTTVTLGTTAAIYEFMVPAGGVRDVDWPIGVAATGAIAVAITGGKGLTDNTAITLNDVSGFITFA